MKSLSINIRENDNDINMTVQEGTGLVFHRGGQVFIIAYFCYKEID